MRRGLNSQAYTIVEVMIFLAISSALLIIALLFVGGQQRKTEFYQSIHDIEQQINDVMNNASTGYYAKTTNFKCFIDVSGDLVFDTTDQSQGTNQGCIFIGRAIQFGVGGSNGSGFNVYNLVGKQYSSGTTEINSLAEARPMALASSTSHSTIPDNTESRTLKYGLKVNKIKYNGTSSDTGAVSFITDFSLSALGGALNSGSRTIKLYAISGSTAINQPKDTIVDAIDTSSPSPLGGADYFVEATDVTICFASGGTNQSGQITIGSENRQLSTKLDIYNNQTCVP